MPKQNRSITLHTVNPHVEHYPHMRAPMHAPGTLLFVQPYPDRLDEAPFTSMRVGWVIIGFNDKKFELRAGEPVVMIGEKDYSFRETFVQVLTRWGILWMKSTAVGPDEPV
jgi:hypothetical protein